VPIGDEEEAVVILLHLYKVCYCSKIISQVQVAGGADAAHYCFHIVFIFFALLIFFFFCVLRLPEVENRCNFLQR
jgi:hypothetical protein